MSDVEANISVLLVEDNPGDVGLIRRALGHADKFIFDITDVGWLNSALTAVSAKRFDVILLDLSLPDSQGLDTVVHFMNSAPDLPVIVMTGHDDMSTGINAVRYGAQDYIIKGDLADRPLERSIVYAIERKRADIVGKQLLRTSVSRITNAPSAPMVSGYMDQVSDFVRDIRAYIARNAPSHLDSLDAIMRKHDMDVVLREIRSFSATGSAHKTQTGLRRASKVSDMAMRAMKTASHDAKVAPASARDAMLGVIESSSEIGGRYSEESDV